MKTNSSTELSPPISIQRPRFRPPLSVQRYLYVCSLIRHISENHQQQSSSSIIESVADLGSGCCRLAWYLKRLPFLRYIRCLDLNVDCFEGNTYVVPSTEERYADRLCPLQIELYQGDVRQNDYRFRHIDIVTCVEMIEHLPIESLDSFAANVFDFIQPGYVIVTTPNFDYNELCRSNDNDNDDVQRDHYRDPRFRDSDHYFEFTRQEFKHWCDQIQDKYPRYKYRLSGVGRLRSLDPDMKRGYATQIAIFKRKTDDNVEQQQQPIESIQNYHHVRTHYFGQPWSRWKPSS
ncbi:hypothetical protein BLA29_008356 [Euroglyphus maynei]|uniref:Small RNA 2'-O-methyltransferase n=1 Tax=Euroglyphus maynei TaxID=6958 RepID=A0A1Y3AUC4_EURMA|nr:hypothetical protein BLA29_008356 [Euroglyphus maynei]